MSHPSLRVTARVIEAIVLSICSGVFVAALGLMFGRLPFVFSAMLGFLAGGVATMQTLGVRIVDRRWRMGLAALGAVLGIGVGQALDYANFIRDQRARHLAVDYRRPTAELDARIADSLRATTGHSGIVGFQLATLELGAPIGPWRLGGPPLVIFRLLELSIALVVATRWAGGPKPSEP